MIFPFEPDIFLENIFAKLIPVNASDTANLLQVATSDRNLLEFSPVPVYTEELLEKYIKNAVDFRQNKIRYTFVVFDKVQQAYAGSTSFLNISDTDSRLEIGATWFGRQFQRTGLNRNCKYLMLEYAFNGLGAERVEFKTDERNIKSRTAIEKIGGRYEGLLRSHTLMPDGFRRNTVCYSILKNEWAALKPAFLETTK